MMRLMVTNDIQYTVEDEIVKKMMKLEYDPTTVEAATGG